MMLAMLFVPLIGMFLFATGAGIAIGSLLGRERAGYIMAASVAVVGAAMIVVPLWM